MPELINEPNPAVDATELATLRKVNAELLQLKHTNKARITELETQALQLTEKADKATVLMRTAVVDVPLKRMVSELSKNVPELVMRELLEDYAFDASEDGTIVVKTKAEGRPILAHGGKPVAWDKHSLHLYLIGNGYAEKNERQRVYAHLLGIPVGSGGVGRKLPTPMLQNGTLEEKKALAPSFGLR